MTDIRTVGVIGAGQMGAGIAQVAAQAGYDVILSDIDLPRAESAGAIAEARRAGIAVVMITGDHPLTALSIARRATARELQHAAASRGFTRLADDGTRRVLDGDTSLEELARVVDLTERLVP